MKRVFVTFLFFLFGVLAFNSTGLAQRNVTPAVERDPLLEADAKHNLDVAWQAFRLKKAYKGVIMRFDETFAAYPEFSKMDEFLYLAGMSSYYLSDNKGKQKVDLTMGEKEKRFSPDRLREDAMVYFSMIGDKYPQSKYREEALKTLSEMKTRTIGSTTSN